MNHSRTLTASEKGKATRAKNKAAKELAESNTQATVSGITHVCPFDILQLTILTAQGDRASKTNAKKNRGSAPQCFFRAALTWYIPVWKPDAPAAASSDTHKRERGLSTAQPSTTSKKAKKTKTAPELPPKATKKSIPAGQFNVPIPAIPTYWRSAAELDIDDDSSEPEVAVKPKVRVIPGTIQSIFTV